VSAADDPAAMHEHRANRDAALGQSAGCLFDCGLQELVRGIHAAQLLANRHTFRTPLEWRVESMVHMALVFLVIGVIAVLLGFTTIAGASFAIAKFLAALFLVLFLIFLIVGLSAARRIVDCVFVKMENLDLPSILIVLPFSLSVII